VMVCHRLGYGNVFDQSNPSMHYLLRMNRPDDYKMLLSPNTRYLDLVCAKVGMKLYNGIELVPRLLQKSGDRRTGEEGGDVSQSLGFDERRFGFSVFS